MNRSDNRTDYNPIPLSDELMNGQSLGAVSGMKFGLGTIGKCGCEVIAVYNMLLLSGMPQPFPKVAACMRKYAMLFGLWGTNPFVLGRCMRKFGLEPKKLRRPDDVRRALEAGNRCIYVYWTKRRLFSAIHTVCMERKQGRLYVYNAYNRVGHAYVTTPDAYFQGRRMLTAYEVCS